MILAPRTKEEAAAYRYGRWGGNPKGNPYREANCAYAIFPSRGIHYQCTRKKGHGPDQLYCKQHAKQIGGNE